MSWLDDALDCGYVKPQWHQEMQEKYRSVGGMIGRMIDRAADFCANDPDTDYRLREESAFDDFYTDPTHD